MSISNKIKPIDNKIKQIKANYNLDKKSTKITALSSESIGRYEFLIGQDALPEKGLLEKTATSKRFKDLKRLTQFF